jgi:predicted CXXCH cytochrome family protein
MRILSLLILFCAIFFVNRFTQSPHGPGFKIACKTCHSPKGWELDKSIYSFNHNDTKLPLLGQHNTIDCRQCHKTLVFNEAKTSCNDCHADMHQSTVGNDCSRCHNQNSWLVNNINQIHQMSRFPLLGAHRTADCSQCHVSESLLKYNVAGVNCVDCHRADYMATKNPDHIKSGMSEECVSCHSVNSLQWSGGSFNHNSFPLVQGHSTVRCIDCHTTGSYSAVSRDCYSCHQLDFVAAKTPDHVSSAFSTNCQTCHTLVLGWKPAAFDHTKFPLTLGHSTANCIDCHKDGNYAITPTDCYSCHKTDFMGTTNPNHVTSGIATTCQTCHTTNPGWKPTSFNHTAFPLTAGHSAPACFDCHKGGNYTSTPKDCFSCHQTDYQSTTNPNHVTSGMSTSCQTCHTTTPGWKPAAFNHGSFPLTLGHSATACADCHKNGNYTSTSTDCNSCHNQDYRATTNPNHVTAGFPTICQSCHTTTPGWKPATFNHTKFPLTLGHSSAACTDCHKNGNYTTTPTDCYSCHQTDFINTTNPNHSSLSFSTTCTQCHTTTPGWKPATFTQHDALFPIYTGNHRGKWDACSDCHNNSASYAVFNCISCHSNEHPGKNYTNAQCYSCHPRGTGD